MGSYINFKNFSDTPQPEGHSGKPAGSFPLIRQSSVYSLTLDEFQNSLGKDFGSMNMDELLKNICTAEDTQTVASSSGGTEGSVPGENLQRQGSLTLPRTLSQKTVDEVWRNLLKDNGGVEDGTGSGRSNMQQRQQSLGEITLEEFLVRAGVVREDTQLSERQTGLYGELTQPSGFTLGFQQSVQNNGMLANQTTNSSGLVPHLSPGSALNAGGVRSSQPHLQPQQKQKLQPLFPKQATVAFASPIDLVDNAQLASPGTRRGAVGSAHPPISGDLGQDGAIRSGGTGMAFLGSGVAKLAARSPVNHLSSNVGAKSSFNTSSLSPLPFMFSEGIRGRKCGGALEKVQERRHRRMIKNRESAARSRARKQAYTLELEAEVAKLKEINEELQNKQFEIMDMQKNQILEALKMPWRRKGKCLRRTLTGPW